MALVSIIGLILYSYLMVNRRTALQRTRVLILTDEIFYGTAIRFQEKTIRSELEKIGYELEIRNIGISDVSSGGRSELVNMFAKAINERPSKLVLMSPIFTAFYDAVGFNSYNYDSIIVKPIMIGTGSILSIGRFDKVYRLENETIYRNEELFEQLNATKSLLYNSGNQTSEAIRVNSFISLEKQFDMNNGKTESISNLMADSNGYFLLAHRFPDNMNLVESDIERIVVPYYLLLFFNNYRGYYVVHPDFRKMIFDTINEHNYPEAHGIDTLPAPYTLSLV
ncbi:MAG TPA: hypothetical protein DCO86_02865 [Spirochaetaceae bacterium]|nr:hypothetical protein [Spirochaetaceae bacterium]